MRRRAGSRSRRSRTRPSRSTTTCSAARAKLVYDGFWFHPVREAYAAFFAKTQELVTGDVRLRLQPSVAVVAGSRSEFALYSETLASYATGETFPHKAAEGLIAITALETELIAARERKAATV